MTRTFALILVAALVVVRPAAGLEEFSFTEGVKYDKSIEKYVLFLEKQKQKSAEYILGLFTQNDLVVLCERFHSEVTQYEMIYEVVSDRRFQQQSGRIFTEIGATTLRPYVESFLQDDQLSETQVNERLRYIARHMGREVAWEKTSFYEFLRKLYWLNRSLPKERRMHLSPSDLDFHWDTATKESWAKFENGELRQRDRIMADNIIREFNEMQSAGRRNKALVIMNYRHGFPHLQRAEGEKGANERADNTTGYLMQAYPGRVANVMINSVAFLPGTTDQQAVLTAVQEGRWDAAFATRGNPDLGFDFKGSPMGEDTFDYFPFIPTRVRYQDVFTGFVFFKPLKEHKLSWGSDVFNQPNGLLDQLLVDEIKRRFRIMGRNLTQQQRELINGLGTVHESRYETENRSDYTEKIQQWLTTGP